MFAALTSMPIETHGRFTLCLPSGVVSVLPALRAVTPFGVVPSHILKKFFIGV